MNPDILRAHLIEQSEAHRAAAMEKLETHFASIQAENSKWQRRSHRANVTVAIIVAIANLLLVAQYSWLIWRIQ